MAMVEFKAINRKRINEFNHLPQFAVVVSAYGNHFTLLSSGSQELAGRNGAGLVVDKVTHYYKTVGFIVS